MTISLVREKVSLGQLKEMARGTYVEMIKAVVDLQRGVIGLGGEMHKDIEAALLVDGSRARDLWGFCLYLERPFAEAFEFRSHINVRPQDGNPSIEIRDEKLRRAIVAFVQERVDWGP